MSLVSPVILVFKGNRRGFELSGVKLVRKWSGRESKKVRVSGRFECLEFEVSRFDCY